MTPFLLTCLLTLSIPFDPPQPWHWGVTGCDYSALIE